MFVILTLNRDKCSADYLQSGQNNTDVLLYKVVLETRYSIPVKID